MLPTYAPPAEAFIESIILGTDSLPAESTSARPPAFPAEGRAEQQMVCIVRDLRAMREQRNAAQRAVRAAQREGIRQLLWLAALREAGGIEHCLRVGALSALIARALEQPMPWCDMLFEAAPLHDLGNLGVPDAILYKHGRLTPQDWRAVRDHPITGARLLAGTSNPIGLLAAEIALNHHERWDGSGYPARRRGTNIPLAGRIVAVADFVDSLGFACRHRAALPTDEVFALLEFANGAQFDPCVVRAMREVRPLLPRVRERVAAWVPTLAEDIGQPLEWHNI
ncbi:MAG: HD-GYP domain-containing protein [Thauera sp.]